MCLAIPGRVTEVYDRAGVRMAQVSFGGMHREVCLEYARDAAQDDYVLVHVGFALAVIDEGEARRTYALLEELGELEELDAPELPRSAGGEGT